MKATFENTVNILLKAYFNDTLRHGDDCACAVGNLICDAMGHNPNRNWHPSWYNYYLLGWPANKDKAELEIKSTGYTQREIITIESAFEHVKGKENELMFNGLMAVVDVLAEIHNVDLTVREESKKLFIKI